MSNVFTWILGDAVGGVPSIKSLPTPDQLRNKDICGVAGTTLPAFIGAKGYIAFDSEGKVYAWVTDETTLAITRLDIPDRVASSDICAVAGIGTGGSIGTFFGSFLALSREGQIFMWRYDDNLDVMNFALPPELKDKRICAISGAGGTAGSIALDDTGRVYVWFVDNMGGILQSVSLPLPSEVIGKNICSISGVYGDNGGQTGFVALDSSGNIYSWNYPNSPGDLTPNFIPTPPELVGRQFCKITGLGGIFGYSVLDGQGNLYIYGFLPTGPIPDNLTPVALAPPAELLDASICDVGGGNYFGTFFGSAYIALDSQGNAYTWVYDYNQFPNIVPISVPLPPEVADRSICILNPIDPMGYAVIECDPLTISCPDDITIVSSQPVAVDFTQPVASNSCYTVECRLNDGTVVTPGFVFPVGVTRVTCRSVARRCGERCMACEQCIPCLPTPVTCSFTVDIKSPESVPISNNNIETIVTNMTIDHIIVNQQVDVRIELF